MTTTSGVAEVIGDIKVIDTDTHLTEPHDLWRSRAPKGWEERVPQVREVKGHPTWVLEGAVEHRDSEGNHGIIEPGLAQRMSAGTGIAHSEMNASPTAPVHLVQMWVLPDTEGLPPGYEQKAVGEALATGDLVPIASGKGHDGAITIHQKDAVLWVGRLAADKTVTVPDAPWK